MSNPSSIGGDVESWKEVHQQLINAVLIAKDAIAIQKAQRRFWLTEINGNLNEDGKLTPNSVWKRPTKKRGKAAKTTGTKRKKKGESDKPAKKRKYTKKKKPQEEAAVAAAEEAEHDLDEEDVDDEEEEEEEEEQVKPKKKLRLSLHLKPPSQPEEAEVEEDQDEETEDEDEDDDDDDDDEDYENTHEDSFLGGAAGGDAMAAGGLSPPDAHSFNSFLPGQFPPFYMQNPRGQGMMGSAGFAAIQDEEEESDEDTEEDDY